MKDRHIAHLESRLERLIEGAFAHFFGRKVRAQDIALQLARAMENGLHIAGPNDPRAIAPDLYQIRLTPDTSNSLLHHQPDLAAILGNYVLELATNAGYRLDNTPVINILADAQLSGDDIHIEARHTGASANSTNIMRRVQVPDETAGPLNPQIVIGRRIIPMEKTLMNIGRSLDNDIVLDDQHTSRHHAQIRLRFGAYTLFDVQSRAGTFVNDVQVKEHRLISGDVIRIGDTRLVYLESKDEENTSEFDRVDNEK